MPSGQSQGPTRRKAPRQPRPGPAPGRALGCGEGLGRAVPSGSVPRARGRGRGRSTSPPGVTNGLGTQAHATFQPRARLERVDTPHSTPAKVGRSKGGPGSAPGDLRAVSQMSKQPGSHPKPLSRDPAQLWEAGSGGAGQDHKTRDVISFCKGRLRPKRRVDLPGAPPAPSPQGQGSRGAAPCRVIPPPLRYTHAHSCALDTRPCTRPSIRSHRGSLHTYPRAYTHTRAGLPPPRNTIPHPTPPARTSSSQPRAQLAHRKRDPHERCTRGGRRLGWRLPEPGSLLHVNEFIN